MNQRLYSIKVIMRDDHGEVQLKFEKVALAFDNGYLQIVAPCNDPKTFEKELPIISINEKRILHLAISDYCLSDQGDLKSFYE